VSFGEWNMAWNRRGRSVRRENEEERAQVRGKSKFTDKT
jgi:hypothetical protein